MYSPRARLLYACRRMRCRWRSCMLLLLVLACVTEAVHIAARPTLPLAAPSGALSPPLTRLPPPLGAPHPRPQTNLRVDLVSHRAWNTHSLHGIAALQHDLATPPRSIRPALGARVSQSRIQKRAGARRSLCREAPRTAPMARSNHECFSDVNQTHCATRPRPTRNRPASGIKAAP